MVQSSERISLWWAVMGSRINAAGTEEEKETKEETVLPQRVERLRQISDCRENCWSAMDTTYCKA